MTNVKLPKRLYYNEKLNLTAKWNKNHRQLLEDSDYAGCYYCCSIFPADMITEWTDKKQTALCPSCNIDSVLPDEKVEITDDFLSQMHDYWFSSFGIIVQFRNGKVFDAVDEGNKYDPEEFAAYRTQQLEHYAKKIN